ncbi:MULTISPECIES: hypothetical protein [Clostridium]|uniref:Uncharacterized protein n=1 Tax=Clostridium frigoriphilum TaxID=443253 RepID=A0ABU7URC4_9CLOT|nr:hypothetical protein [Clostridium sp. DSM 17811]MBU3100889.1 hypothetical protein [Clostridium sp. DSM 17811]
MRALLHIPIIYLVTSKLSVILRFWSKLLHAKLLNFSRISFKSNINLHCPLDRKQFVDGTIFLMVKKINEKNEYAFVVINHRFYYFSFVKNNGEKKYIMINPSEGDIVELKNPK